LQWYDAGADGIFLFNMPDAWTGLRNLPAADRLCAEVAAGQPFGVRAGDPVQWLED